MQRLAGATTKMSVRNRASPKTAAARKRQKARRLLGGSPRGGACFCYIVECSDGTFYTGWAVDAGRRVQTHNAGRGGRYTRTRRPVKLVYVEPQPDHASAMRRERAIKDLPRARKQALIDTLAAGTPIEAQNDE
ncbi:MAG TPA: GIY-YIG nuclease family protein [Anaerolineales bacterium]|nr:GIY-YIG nuclease family protein [Anaerolineales bacterium]